VCLLRKAPGKGPVIGKAEARTNLGDYCVYQDLTRSRVILAASKVVVWSSDVLMDRAADLETALTFVVRRIEEQAKESGHPLNDEEHSLLKNLPSTNVNLSWAAPELGPPDLVPRNINLERLCSLAKTAHLNDRKINPESLDWEFAFAIFRLNRHPIWGVLSSGGVKMYRRPLWDQLFLILAALLPVIALILLVANATRSTFWWAGILCGTVAIMLLIFLASRKIEQQQLENYIERCRLASRNIS
jgi:hypothetical protein